MFSRQGEHFNGELSSESDDYWSIAQRRIAFVGISSGDTEQYDGEGRLLWEHEIERGELVKLA